MINWRVIVGDVREKLAELPDQSVQCCVTSPPYFGLRDYGADGQIGLEPSPAEYVNAMVAVFRLVREALAENGTIWINLGDSYANDGKWGGHTGGKHVKALHCSPIGRNKRYTGLKPKDLIGIPWRVAFALQADGWYLRLDVIWSKPNPMPESVTDRPTKAHEYIFLLSKSERYHYDAKAIAEPLSEQSISRYSAVIRNNEQYDPTKHKSGDPFAQKSPMQVLTTAAAGVLERGTRNVRSVWTVPTQPYPEAHFATFPEELPTRCILAGSREGDTVLDPFCGSGTTGAVAVRLQRNFIGIELNPQYAELSRKRIGNALPMFSQEVSA